MGLTKSDKTGCMVSVFINQVLRHFESFLVTKDRNFALEMFGRRQKPYRTALIRVPINHRPELKTVKLDWVRN